MLPRKMPRSARRLRITSEAMLLERSDREYLGRLEPGQAIVKLQGRYHRPFLVRFPLVQVRKGVVTDEQLGKRFQGHSEALEDIRAQDEAPDEIQAVRGQENNMRASQYSLTEDERRMLIDVITHRTSGVADRYKRLGLSAHRGSRLLDSLVSRGFLSSIYVATGTGRVRYLDLTERARELLRKSGYPSPNRGRGSPEHEYWKYRIAEHLQGLGYQVEIEKPLGQGKAIDIVASKDGMRVAIEVETGRSDVVASVMKGLVGSFDRVLLASTRADVISKIKAALQKRGLLQDERVQVVHVSKVLAGLPLVEGMKAGKAK